MTAQFELNAQPREQIGKGTSRRLRRQGWIPAVMYGGHLPPESLSIEHREIAKQLENEAFYSHIITVKIEGKSQQAILKALQRHPWKPFVTHVDLQRITADEKVKVHVPLHFTNEATSYGVKTQGGLITHQVVEVEVSCLPKDLPEFIEVDVIDLKAGEIYHLSDLKLPAGVELIELSHNNDLAVVSIQAKRGGDTAES